MKVIKFGSAVYDLVDDINVHGTRLQATVYKGEQSVEQIAENTTGVEEIKVYEADGTLLGVYNGFTQRVAVSLYTANDAPVVSIELENADVATQVADLAEASELQAGAIEGLAEEVSSINESQEVQDTAIESLAEAVSGLEPTE